jgi:hypothetical protein
MAKGKIELKVSRKDRDVAYISLPHVTRHEVSDEWTEVSENAAGLHCPFMLCALGVQCPF